MQIVRTTHRINATQQPVPNNNYLAQRIGFWGLVSAQNSLNNTVTVISDTGYELKNIPVFSSEWVTVDDNKNYIPSTRNLPPVKSRVFVLTPTYTAVGAFVLCSGFSKGDENIRTLWAQNENELEAKNNCRETKTQGGWDIQEEYANGNYSAKSNDENIIFTANTTQDDDKSQVKEVSLTAWENSIVINEDGISVTDKNGNTIQSTEDGILVTDANGNTIQSGIADNKELFKVEVVKKSEGVVTERSSILLNSNKATITVGGDSGTKIEQTASSVKINNHLEVLV